MPGGGKIEGTAHIKDFYIDENTREIRVMFVEENVPSIIRLQDLTGNISEEVRRVRRSKEIANNE